MRLLLAALMVIGFAGAVYAAPVGLISEADATNAEWSYNDITASIGFIGDSLERKISIDSGDFEMASYAARIGLNIIERFNFYVDLGQAQDMELTWTQNGEKIKYEFEDEFLWGIGGSALIYRWDNGIEIGVNAAYRSASMNFDKGDRDGTAFTKATVTSFKDGDYEDYHVACEVGWRTDYFIPYIGVRYSEVEVDGYFVENGATHDAQGKGAAQNVGVFVGLSITPKIEGMPKSEQFALNIEGRFIDEEAVSVGLSYKF